MLLINKKCSNCNGYYDSTLKKCPHCYKSNELYLNRQISNNILFLHPLAQVGLFLAGFAFGGMLIAELIFSIFTIGIKDNESLRSTVILSLTYLSMFVGLLMIPLVTRRKEFLSKYKRPLDYIYGIAYAITIVLASMALSALISLFYEAGDNANQVAVIQVSKNYPILAFFILGIIGPICEELTYRVGLYSLFRRINKYLAFAITIIIFALIHFDFESFTNGNLIEELWALPSYVLSGLILTLAYEHRGPACSMTAHMAYNTFAFLMILIAK